MSPFYGCGVRRDRVRCWWASNLVGGRPDTVRAVMKGGQEGMSRRGRGSRVIRSTHVCGSVSSVVPHVVHQGGKVLQAVWDIVRKEKDAHRLRRQTHRVRDHISFLLLKKRDDKTDTGVCS